MVFIFYNSFTPASHGEAQKRVILKFSYEVAVPCGNVTVCWFFLPCVIAKEREYQTVQSRSKIRATSKIPLSELHAISEEMRGKIGFFLCTDN